MHASAHQNVTRNPRFGGSSGTQAQPREYESLIKDVTMRSDNPRIGNIGTNAQIAFCLLSLGAAALCLQCWYNYEIRRFAPAGRHVEPLPPEWRHEHSSQRRQPQLPLARLAPDQTLGRPSTPNGILKNLTGALSRSTGNVSSEV